LDDVNAQRAALELQVKACNEQLQEKKKSNSDKAMIRQVLTALEADSEALQV
jgi:hypothetical protein